VPPTASTARARRASPRRAAAGAPPEERSCATLVWRVRCTTPGAAGGSAWAPAMPRASRARDVLMPHAAGTSSRPPAASHSRFSPTPLRSARPCGARTPKPSQRRPRPPPSVHPHPTVTPPPPRSAARFKPLLPAPPSRGGCPSVGSIPRARTTVSHRHRPPHHPALRAGRAPAVPHVGGPFQLRTTCAASRWWAWRPSWTPSSAWW